MLYKNGFVFSDINLELCPFKLPLTDEAVAFFCYGFYINSATVVSLQTQEIFTDTFSIFFLYSSDLDFVTSKKLGKFVAFGVLGFKRILNNYGFKINPLVYDT